MARAAGFATRTGRESVVVLGELDCEDRPMRAAVRAVGAVARIAQAQRVKRVSGVVSGSGRLVSSRWQAVESAAHHGQA